MNVTALKSTTETTLTPIVDVTLVRAWAALPEFSEFYRRFPPVWSATDEGLRALVNTCYYVYSGETVVGIVSMSNFETTARHVDVGIAILPCENRREIAEAATRQVVEYIFDQCGYRKVIFKILAHRRKLAEWLLALGCKHEGTLRESCFWQGTYHDECIFGLLSEEFQRNY